MIDVRWTETAGAVVVLAWTWLEIGAGVAWLPTWLSVGPVTASAVTVPPTLLGALVAGDVLAEWRRAGRPVATRLLVGGLGALTAVCGVFAVVHLVVNTPGVYFAALFPLITGVPLALVLLTRDAVGLIRGFTDATRHPANR